jgi:hypothetical protein
MARQYGVAGPAGVVFVNDVSTRQFGVAGIFVDATATVAYTLTASAGSYALSGSTAEHTHSPEHRQD